jgi:predicted kinase
MIILMGLQASGKSTFYRTHFAATHEHVSKDLLRRSKHKNKDQEQAERIESVFQEQRSVVVDNTNSTLQDRQRLIELGRTYGARIIGYYFPPDVKSSRERNKQRTGKAQVPDIAIYIIANKFVPPSYAEGFDKLYYVRVADDSTSEYPKWEIKEVPYKTEDYDA